MNNQNKNKIFRAIVFDYGGVLKFSGGPNVIDEVAKMINVPASDLRNEYFKFNNLSNVGNMPWEEMFFKVVSVFDDTDDTKNRVFSFLNDYRKNNELNTELISILPRLRNQGYKLAIFSNNTTLLRDKLEKDNLLEFFDDVVISAEIGFQKPHKEAFEILFDKLDVKPKEMIFIDDSPKSLEKSNEIGYTPILFENNKKLKSDLLKLGIKM